MCVENFTKPFIKRVLAWSILIGLSKSYCKLPEIPKVFGKSLAKFGFQACLQ
jgi:hypothetical protein